MDIVSNCTVAILAGGRSRRMGTDKSMLAVGGQPLLARVIESVRPLRLPALLVTNTPDVHAPFGLTMHSDILPGNGSLGGLYTALHVTDTPLVLVLACDMPCLNAALLRHLIDLASRTAADAVVPRAEGRPHPLHAVYRRDARPTVEAQIARGLLRINGLFDTMPVRWVDDAELRRHDPDLRSLVNLNTPADLAALLT